MRYFANPCAPRVVAAMRDGQLGYIDTPRQGNRRPRDVEWCADNGRFGKGWPGPDAWWAWLEANAADAGTCAFAVAPDVVADAAATLVESLPWLPRIRRLGYRAAFVAQDGAEREGVPWGDLDVLFLGGSTEWKLGPHARGLAAQALGRGVPVHMGRVNSGRRFRYAAAIGCASADGTFLTFGPESNLPRVLAWIRTADQLPLPLPVERLYRVSGRVARCASRSPPASRR